jgi:hypothetical protein
MPPQRNKNFSLFKIDMPELSTLQKLGGVLAGAAALLGAILLIQWIRDRRAPAPAPSGQVGVVSGSGIAPPCVAPSLAMAPQMTGCGAECAPSTGHAMNDLFPGSYVAMGFNMGCEITDPRNKRC